MTRFFALTLGIAVALAADGSQRVKAQGTVTNTAACLERASRETNLLDIQLRRLCWATPSPTAPVACYLAASQTLLLTDPQSIELCRCTRSMAPITCYEEVRREALLTEPEMVAICSPTISQLLRWDCTSALGT
jgi:hypothetical protein